MNELVAVRHASTQELTEWRRKTARGRVRQTPSGYYWTDGQSERAVSVHRPELPEASPTDDPNTGRMELPPLSSVRRDARTIRDSMTERRVESLTRLANRDPEFWKDLVENYIKKFRPELTAGRTTEEMVRLIIEAQNKDAVQQAFKRKGRDIGNAQ
jgi:translation initiation factor 2 beta subunit (eIF-2beta)/eIF-5